MPDDPGAGWDEPRIRLLRSAAALALLFLLGWLVVVEDGPNDIATIGTTLGALLVLLGYEAGLRLPPGGRK